MLDTQERNPEDFLSIVTNVDLSRWGSDLQIECVVDAVDRQTWVLHFKKCREINWYIHEPEAMQDQEAELFSFTFGRDNHQEPAMIGTDIFDVSVRYESFELYKR
jgi:hypothetical protein